MKNPVRKTRKPLPQPVSLSLALIVLLLFGLYISRTVLAG